MLDRLKRWRGPSRLLAVWCPAGRQSAQQAWISILCFVQSSRPRPTSTSPSTLSLAESVRSLVVEISISNSIASSLFPSAPHLRDSLYNTTRKKDTIDAAFLFASQADRKRTFWHERSVRTLGKICALMATCVCLSSPVTMLPSVRSAGLTMDHLGWLRRGGKTLLSHYAVAFDSDCVNSCWRTKPLAYRRSSTSRVHTPASTTSWMRSTLPSEMYESAQHASTNRG